jgi:hypothetical protein
MRSRRLKTGAEALADFYGCLSFSHTFVYQRPQTRDSAL